MNQTAIKPLPFMKMHGLGNDFVVIDSRADGGSGQMTADLARRIADRNRGIGFDQLAVIDISDTQDIGLAFWNADGSMSAACGNATRCIADWEMARRGTDRISIATRDRVLHARRLSDGMVSVNMGQPMLRWDQIPLAQDVDTLALPIEGAPTATSMGNPHCTFFVDDAWSVDLGAFGPAHEHHPLFPERTNVQVVQVLSPTHLRMRVWERGTGVTLASGSSSCAVAVAAARRGLAEKAVKISLDGGDLQIDWREDGVWMTGPTMHVCDGVLLPGFLNGA